MGLISCLLLPTLTVEVMGRAAGLSSDAPVIILSNTPGRKVVAYSERAAHKGIVLGLTRAQALWYCPEAHCLSEDESLLEQAERDVLRICARFTPRVEAAPGGQAYAFYLDWEDLAPAEGERLSRMLLSQVETELGFIFPTDPVNLTAFSRSERLRGEYATLGLSTGEHPMALYREKMAALGILGTQGLGQSKSGSIVRVGGQVVMHQAPPTAKGHHFVTLEDEDGMMNIILRPQVYARFREVIRESPLLVVEGEVQKRGAVVNLLARRVWRLG
ncbi:Error-prone DNA polymerase [Planctomycetaceae bacterium]|nr:Error-prone DNA polymerase [Planctomycetaceae bacterium]